MSKADIYSQYLHEQIGEPYLWGDEGPDSHDCSGLYWEGMHEADVYLRGHPFPRLTADNYYHLGVPVAKPEYVGADAGFIVNASGTAVHIIPYVGLGYTIEARGRKWGVVKYALDDPINGAYRRKAKWRRLPVNLGELTEEDMTPEEHNVLIDLRYMVAQKASFTAAITNALLINDKAKAKELNDHFWQTWPEGDPGLPKNWQP